ncbi:MAG: hypothetical protein Q8939_08160, partial [Bacteroidota bacterium]|nr:hypothetical protein [Bacteroidota bacterium]
MKASLAHLPATKQVEIARITEIIREVVKPEMIILFGTYAKRTYVERQYITGDGIRYENNDQYDFLVVTNENPEKTHIQERLIMERTDRHAPPVNLEIHDIGYINRGLETGEFFFVDIVTGGISLYDTGRVQFVSPKGLTGT